MGKRTGIIAWFLFLIYSVVIALCAALYIASYALFSQTLEGQARQSINQYLDTGEELLNAYANGNMTQQELSAAVNPAYLEGGFLLLCDAQGNVLAYTETSLPYLVTNTAEELLGRLREGDSTAASRVSKRGTSAYLTGKSIASGYVLAGVALPQGALQAFRLRLFLMMLAILLLVMLPSSYIFRRATAPARLLTDAANSLIHGDTVLVPEDMRGGMKEIATAFNTMSRRIAEAFRQLRTERDSMNRILNSLNEGVYAVDRFGAVTLRNQAADMLLGAEDSQPSQEVLHKLKDMLRRAENAGDRQDVSSETGKLTLPDKVLEVVVTPLFEEDRDLRGAAAMIRDITEAEKLERTRHDYVANISHELRTPLASIKGLGEGLRDGLVTTPESQQKVYGIITDEATRLSRLVNDLLELSGLQSRVSAFEVEKIDPQEVVYDLFDRNISLFQQAGIAFAYDLPGEELPCVSFNEDRLFEVLTIFLDNARKFTPEGGRVTLSAEREDAGVRFSVRDTGIGMDEATQKKVFDRFEQADVSHSGQGSGLGLAIAREIMQKMNIEIRLVSAVDAGSMFSFVLPWWKAE